MWKYFCGLCALFLLSCTSTSKEKTLSITEQTASRPDSFASDSVMLDYIQRCILTICGMEQNRHPVWLLNVFIWIGTILRMILQ